ncbi:hypothetical protein NHQ30_010911 [Ciborinia camelliae]|nr:hypothetical protein NHQ30_010911 [Ciborinia camelliae]
MQIDPNCIISSDRYDKFERSKSHLSSDEMAQDYLDGGLLNQDAIYERYTETLFGSVINNNFQSLAENNVDRGGPWQLAWKSYFYSELEKFKQFFYQLCDPEEAKYLSHGKFSSFIEERFPSFKLIETSDGPSVLFEIFSWHSFFPFPVLYNDTGTPRIDAEGFIRAVCLLMCEPPPRYAPEFSTVTYGYIGGEWGPFSGAKVRYRGKDNVDYTRRLFRSFAIPNNTITNHETTLPIPRFEMRQPQPDEEDSEDDLGQQIIIVEHENERSVDTLDVLSEYDPPVPSRMFMTPLRESYAVALPSLPSQSYDLADLHVPTAKLVTLLKLIQAVHVSEEQSEPGKISDLIVSVERLGTGGEVSWEMFNTLMSKHAELVSIAFTKIFRIFKEPLGKTGL